MQQLREAFPENRAPQYLILDRDDKFSGEVAQSISNQEGTQALLRWPWTFGSRQHEMTRCGSRPGHRCLSGLRTSTSEPFQIQAASARMRIMKNSCGKRREERMATVLREYLREIGRRGGKARTARKAAAARENGKLGGQRKSRVTAG